MSVAAGPARAAPLRLRTRLTVVLALVITSAAAVTATASWWLARRALEGRIDERLAAVERGVRSDLRADAESLARLLERAERQLTGEDPELVQRLLDPSARTSPAVVDAAGRLGRRIGLDLLEILASDGEVLSSRHFPERAGERDTWAIRLSPGVASWRRLTLPGGDEVVQVLRRPVAVGPRRLELIGGAGVSESLLARRSGPDAMVVFVPAGHAARGPGDAEGVAELAAVAGEAPSVVEAGGRRWSALAFPVGGAGRDAPARVVVAVGRSAAEAALSRLALALAAVVAVALALGTVCGRWLAGRAARPVEQTLRAVDAIAAGEADYAFSRFAEDGLGALPEAFSRLHRRLEEQQRRRAAAERAAAWKEVARRVAHEVKNPLAPIRLTVQNLIKARRQAPSLFDEIFDEGARAILEEVAQLERLVTEFSEFARLPEARPRSVDLDEVVDSVLALYGGERELVVIRRRGDPAADVHADPELLARALKNLVSNAVEAMGDTGGSLTVETGRDERGGAFVRILDDGPGFSDEALRRLFQPYFTTKPQGTGLGMAIARRIVIEQGGALTAENRPGGGARVTVTLHSDSMGGAARPTPPEEATAT